MIIRWQSKSRLVSPFQQINSVIRSAKQIVTTIDHDVTGLEYSMTDNRVNYSMQNNRIQYSMSDN